MSRESKSDKNLIGAAGEHLVLSRLLTRGILAAQAPRGTRKADVLANHLDRKASCLVQVKTRLGSGSEKSWVMSKKHEDMKESDLFYCFVDIGKANPNVYVIPAKVVAKVCKLSHETWMSLPGAKGQKHNDSDMRKIRNDYKFPIKGLEAGWMEQYLERWDLVE